MPTYAIGDVQGCFEACQRLLRLIQFNSKQDQLWFVGDLVNRGSQSLEVLRFVKSLGKSQVSVLGNHDLHLLAVAFGVRALRPGDTLRDILDAPDCGELIDWLRHRPLLHEGTGYVMTHAGLAPMWTAAQATQLAKEVETALQSDQAALFLENMYGDEPDDWQDNLTGMARLRCITNYFTRMRFCDISGKLMLGYKGTIADKPAGLIPWFEVPERCNANEKIIFGHWAALEKPLNKPNLYPLDTGCVWGNCLTAMRLEDGKLFSVSC
jgi:bis(5'-nucleosyl)-tetraphosphatase (symmetrical)